MKVWSCEKGQSVTFRHQVHRSLTRKLLQVGSTEQIAPGGLIPEGWTMVFMIRIGLIDVNMSGVGARGYAVGRSGKTVTVLFGKVEAVGKKTRFRWAKQPKRLVYRRATKADAKFC
jgi:hypothetical protein